MTEFEIGQKVSFRLSDSVRATTGVVESVDVNDFEGMRPALEIYTVRDDRRGWVHRVTVERDNLQAC